MGNWEQILDRIAHLRWQECLKIDLVMQVDTKSHRIPKFIEKAARAGCTKVFVGLEQVEGLFYHRARNINAYYEAAISGQIRVPMPVPRSTTRRQGRMMSIFASRL